MSIAARVAYLSDNGKHSEHIHKEGGVQYVILRNQIWPPQHVPLHVVHNDKASDKPHDDVPAVDSRCKGTAPGSYSSSAHKHDYVNAISASLMHACLQIEACLHACKPGQAWKGIQASLQGIQATSAQH